MGEYVGKIYLETKRRPVRTLQKCLAWGSGSDQGDQSRAIADVRE